MSPRVLERTMWGMVLLLLCAAVAGWREGTIRAATPVGVSDRVPTAVIRFAPDTLDAWESEIVDGDLFRASRAPSPVAFGSATGSATPSTPRALPLSLSVTGIIGPPWEAVVEGMPGKETGVVVRPGDRYGELRVRTVRRDTVVIQGADTTWRLTVRRAW